MQPVDPAAKVNTVFLRATSLKSPSGTFAKYLEDAMRADLKEISVYDEAGATRVDAVILRNEVSVDGVATGTSDMRVELTVSRGEVRRLQKIYEAHTKFDSAFAGAIAITTGRIEYPNLVRALLRNVYSDPAFVSAVSK